MQISKISPIMNTQNTQPVHKEPNNEKQVVVTTQQEEPKEKKVNEEELIKAIESANKKVEVYDRRFEFSIHDKTKEIVVKVIDTNLNEVIREIPNQKILDMVANMLEIAGILVDEKA